MGAAHGGLRCRARWAPGAATSPAWSSAAWRPPACSPTAPPKPRSPIPSGCRRRRPACGIGAGIRAVGRRCAARAGQAAAHGSKRRSWTRSRGLRKGPEAFGFDTDLWTLARIAAVIEQLTGVGFHPGHVWRLLRRLGWSVQRPARRAAERDEAEIARWRAEEWPRIKGGAEPRRLALLPGRVRRVAAPAGAGYLGAAGHTPILRHRGHWKRASMAGSAATAPTGRGPGCACTASPTATTTRR
jgi:winged helix-turn-helix protein